jgi:hypothetical protein
LRGEPAIGVLTEQAFVAPTFRSSRRKSIAAKSSRHSVQAPAVERRDRGSCRTVFQCGRAGNWIAIVGVVRDRGVAPEGAQTAAGRTHPHLPVPGACGARGRTRHGKKAVLEHALAHARAPTAWLTCPPLGRDPGQLLARLVGAFRARSPAPPSGHGLLTASPQAMRGPHRLLRKRMAR